MSWWLVLLLRHIRERALYTKPHPHLNSSWTPHGLYLDSIWSHCYGIPQFLESTWSQCGICGVHFKGHLELQMHLCGLHLESKVVCSPYWFHVESMWSPPESSGVHVKFMWSPPETSGVHPESMWSPPESSGVHLESMWNFWSTEVNILNIILII